MIKLKMLLHSTKLNKNSYFLSSRFLQILIQFLNLNFELWIYNSIEKWFRHLNCIWWIHWIIFVCLRFRKYVANHLIFICDSNFTFQLFSQLFSQTYFWIQNLWLVSTSHIKSLDVPSIFKRSHASWIINSWMINGLNVGAFRNCGLQFVLLAPASKISYIWH